VGIGSEINDNNIIKYKPAERMFIYMDETRVPVAKKETKNRKGKRADGLAKTREAR
jgi:hypothetical protein